MIRLVIAEDHAIVRSGLKQIFALVEDFAVVGEATSGNEVLALLHDMPFDLLLLDITMPGISGADLITRVRAHLPELPILVLTMHNEAQVATRALNAGANGYVTKDCEPAVLIAAIRKVAAHGRYIAPELAEKMVFGAVSAVQHPPHHALSARELDILCQLTGGKSVTQIAEAMAISNKTVSTHKARLMEKLHVSSMADLMRYALQHDLLN